MESMAADLKTPRGAGKGEAVRRAHAAGRSGRRGRRPRLARLRVAEADEAPGRELGLARIGDRSATTSWRRLSVFRAFS